MLLNRTTAALLLFAANIPVFAAAPPALPAHSCEVSEQTLVDLAYASELDAFAPTSQSATLILHEAKLSQAYAPQALLVEFAMKLRDIRYRHGGRAPATGFDCSGFVQYVFAHALGAELPDDSASQYHTGVMIHRNELRTGDLVFFHTKGKRISHVGIYLDNGRFIHSPSTGKRVRVDGLDDHYWAQHYAGAKRLDVLT